MKSAKERVQEILRLADIKVGGKRDWDIIVNDDRFYSRVLAGGSLALGESYIAGWWDCKKVDELIYRILRSELTNKIRPSLGLAVGFAKARLMNRQSKKRAFEVGEKHYDAGNDLYKRMLDKRLVYTCGYWARARTLDDAQEAKLDLVCKKIGLKKGQKILDIGCGWGSFAKFAAEKYGAKVVGVTISKEQVKLARENCKGLPVEIRLQDYREVDEKFDHIVSLGMFEHVGRKNYRTYMKVVERCLKDDGLFLLHTIGRSTPVRVPDPWIDKYIFPNGMLPCPSEIAKAVEGLFVLEDWHNFGEDYDKTLMEWDRNFRKHWKEIKENYSDEFYRMWDYYLLICAGAFRARSNQLWQIVLSKKGVDGGYRSVR